MRSTGSWERVRAPAPVLCATRERLDADARAGTAARSATVVRARPNLRGVPLRPRPPWESAVTEKVHPVSRYAVNLSRRVIALIAVVSLGAVVFAVVVSVGTERCDELTPRYDATPYHQYPRLLWATPSELPFRVSRIYGGSQVAGEWYLNDENVLVGAPASERDMAAPWRWLATRQTAYVGNTLWLKYARVPVPRDLTRVGRSTELEGWWWWFRSGGAVRVALRPDGEILDQRGRTHGRWAGDEELILICPDAKCRGVRVLVFARDLESESEPGWSGGPLYVELDDDQQGCDSAYLRRE